MGTIPHPQLQVILDAIQRCDEIGGPEGTEYLAIMDAVIESASARRRVFVDGLIAGARAAEHRVRVALARQANLVGGRSSRPGAPRLIADSPVKVLVEWLYWCDGNGSWEEESPMTAGEAWIAIQEIVEED